MPRTRAPTTRPARRRPSPPARWRRGAGRQAPGAGHGGRELRRPAGRAGATERDRELRRATAFEGPRRGNPGRRGPPRPRARASGARAEPADDPRRGDDDRPSRSLGGRRVCGGMWWGRRRCPGASRRWRRAAAAVRGPRARVPPVYPGPCPWADGPRGGPPWRRLVEAGAASCVNSLPHPPLFTRVAGGYAQPGPRRPEHPSHADERRPTPPPRRPRAPGTSLRRALGLLLELARS